MSSMHNQRKRKLDPKRIDGPAITHLVIGLDEPGDGIVFTLTEPLPAGTQLRVARSMENQKRLNLDCPKSIRILRDKVADVSSP